MADGPRVSVITIFLDEARFLEAAVASVRAQTFRDWELLLVDDGSSDGSSEIAKRHAAAEPARVRYLAHPGHENRGMSASRNAGLAAARGKIVTFLDGDDVWLPHRLERGVALLASHPEAAMAYGRTRYWNSWADDRARGRDWIQPHGFPADRTIQPPELLRMFLAGEAALPCTGSLTVRREAALACGGFVDEFRSLYEDQAFLARFCLDFPVYVSEEQWDLYRQHPEGACATAERNDQAEAARQEYHAWLASLLEARDLHGTPLSEAALHARSARRVAGWRSRIVRAWRRASARLRETPERPAPPPGQAPNE